MKRYLLLASVAGCLLSAGNAWAASVDTSGLSATINAKGTINQAAVITNAEDLNFGTINIAGFPPSTATALVSRGYGAGDSVVPISAQVISVTGTSSAAHVYITAVSEPTVDVTCVNGGASATDNNCQVGDNSGLFVGDIAASGMEQDYNDYHWPFGATLYATKAGVQAVLDAGGSFDGTAFVVTLDY